MYDINALCYTTGFHESTTYFQHTVLTAFLYRSAITAIWYTSLNYPPSIFYEKSVQLP